MRIVGLTVECRTKFDEESVTKGNASKAPPVDEEMLEAAAELAEAGELTPSDLDKMNIAQLKVFAEENGIDLGSAKLKAEIIAAIVAAMFYAETPETE